MIAVLGGRERDQSGSDREDNSERELGPQATPKNARESAIDARFLTSSANLILESIEPRSVLYQSESTGECLQRASVARIAR